MNSSKIVDKLLEDDLDDARDLFQHAPTAEHTIVLHSSGGWFRFNDEGFLVDKHLTDYEWTESNIPARLDIAEWLKTYPGQDPYASKEDPYDQGHDILDWGYWTADGAYEPPAHEWREQQNHP